MTRHNPSRRMGNPPTTPRHKRAAPSLGRAPQRQSEALYGSTPPTAVRVTDVTKRPPGGREGAARRACALDSGPGGEYPIRDEIEICCVAMHLNRPHSMLSWEVNFRRSPCRAESIITSLNSCKDALARPAGNQPRSLSTRKMAESFQPALRTMGPNGISTQKVMTFSSTT